MCVHTHSTDPLHPRSVLKRKLRLLVRAGSRAPRARAVLSEGGEGWQAKDWLFTFALCCEALLAGSGFLGCGHLGWVSGFKSVFNMSEKCFSVAGFWAYRCRVSGFMGIYVAIGLDTKRRIYSALMGLVLRVFLGFGLWGFWFQGGTRQSQ